MHDNIWFLDIANPITQMLVVFTDAGKEIPTMVHLDRKYGKIVKKDLISIIEFIGEHKNQIESGEIYE